MLYQEEIEYIKRIEPCYEEKIQKMNQGHLQIIIGLLTQRISYEAIENWTGYSFDIIEQIYRKYLPEQYLAMIQSNDDIATVIQTVCKKKWLLHKSGGNL